MTEALGALAAVPSLIDGAEVLVAFGLGRTMICLAHVSDERDDWEQFPAGEPLPVGLVMTAFESDEPSWASAVEHYWWHFTGLLGRIAAARLER